MNKDEWLAQRKLGLGGTDVAAILGHHPYKSAHDVWLDKMGKAPDLEPNERMKMGLLLEPVIVQMYETQHGVVLMNADFMRDPDKPFLCGTPDYIDVSNATLVEIKTVNGYALKTWNDEIPIHYWLQMQHYMYLTGLKKGVLVTLSDGIYYREWFADFDVEYYNSTVIPACKSWWATHIEGLVEPPRVVPVEANIDADAIQADEKLSATYHQLVQMKALAKQIENKEKELRKEIEAALGSSTTLVVDGKTAVTWKASTRESFDSNQLLSEMPEIYSKYVKQVTVRTFSVKGSK